MYQIRSFFLLVILAAQLFAQTDSLRISWNLNPEPDMQEYRLYRAVNATANFQILQTILHPQTQAVDRNGIQPGNLYSFTLTAVDTGDLQSEFSDTVAVGIPAINWTLNQITNGQATSVPLNSFLVDPDEPVSNLILSFSNINHLQVSRVNNNLLLTPEPLSYTGSAGFSLQVEDTAGFWDHQDIVLQVTVPANNPPTINSTPITVATVDSLYRYQVIASDPDPADTLTFSLISSPAFLNVNPATGLISGIPQVSDIGSHPISVRVTDLAGAIDTQNYTLQVGQSNQPPAITNIPNQTIQEGVSFTAIALDNYVSDPDDLDSLLDWSFSGNSELTITINPQRIATITIPDPNWNGSENVIWRAEDPDGLFALDTSTYTVQAVNDPPQITSQPVTGATRDSLYHYQVQAVDPDAGDSLTFSLTVAPQFLQINSQTGLISGTPVLSDTGQHDVTVRVEDLAGSTDTQSYILTVAYQNFPPVISQIPDQTIQEGSSFTSISLDNYVNDPNDPDNLIDWSFSGNSELTITINPQRIATITIPDPNWNGSETIIWWAEDPVGLFDVDTSTFTVQPVNDPPQITSQPVTGATRDSLYQYQVQAVDPDAGDNLTFSLTVSPQFLQINSQTGLISGIPVLSDTGQHNVTVRVQDLAGSTDIQSYILTVAYQNFPPVISQIPDQTIEEGSSFTAIALDNYVSDPNDPDSLIDWSFSGNSALAISINPQRIATIIIPNQNWNGTETVIWRAEDPVGLFALDTSTFTVQPVNDPPQIISQPVTGATRDSLYRYQVQAVDPDAGDNLTFSLMVFPQFLQINSQTGLISGIPVLSDTGQHNVTVRVQDLAGSTDTQSFILTVVYQNFPPVISQIPNQIIPEGGQFYPISLDDYLTDPEDDDAEITWIFRGNLDLIIAIDFNRTLTVQIPDSEWSGVEDIILTAYDPGGLSDEDTVRFQVLPVNDPPILQLSELLIESGGSHIIDLKPFAFDIDNSVQELNWEFLDYTHFQFSWEDLSNKLVRIDKVGTANFEIGHFVVQDPAGLADTAEVRILYRVEGTNTAPSLVFLPPQIIINEDVVASLDLFSVVIDSSNTFSELRWNFYPSSELDYLYNSESGFLQISASPDWYGIADFRIRVTDPEGLYDERTFQVIVKPRVDLTNIQIRTVSAGEVEVAVEADLPHEASFTFWVNPSLQSTYKTLDYALNHLFVLRNLVPDTTYRYSLTLTDTSGYSHVYEESSFQTGLTPSQITDAANIIVYPNPFRPTKGHSVVVFDNLPQEMTGLLIYTPAGETVFEKEIEGLPQSRMPWNVINDNGEQLASGFYIYVVKGENGKKIKSGKLAVIR